MSYSLDSDDAPWVERIMLGVNVFVSAAAAALPSLLSMVDSLVRVVSLKHKLLL